VDYAPIVLIFSGILLVSGAAFAIFLGVASSRIEAARHAEVHGKH
jgi:hypothetical protein